jgi:DNA polymerase-3 subunit gamma/tau
MESAAVPSLPAASRPSTPPPSTPPPSTPPPSTAAPKVAAPSLRLDGDRWLELVAASPLRGPARELASHAGFVAHEGDVLRLSLSPADEHLKAPALVRMLVDALTPSLGTAPQIRFEAAQAAAETFHQRNTRERDARQVAAEQAFVNDPGVQRLMTRHGATVVPDSIRPFDEA